MLPPVVVRFLGNHNAYAYRHFAFWKFVIYIVESISRALIIERVHFLVNVTSSCLDMHRNCVVIQMSKFSISRQQFYNNDNPFWQVFLRCLPRECFHITRSILKETAFWWCHAMQKTCSYLAAILQSTVSSWNFYFVQSRFCSIFLPLNNGIPDLPLWLNPLRLSHLRSRYIGKEVGNARFIDSLRYHNLCGHLMYYSAFTCALRGCAKERHWGRTKYRVYRSNS